MATDAMHAAEDETPRLWGYLAQFDDEESLIHAAEKVRDAGFTAWDCHTPYPVHGMDKAMGIRRTVLPLLTFGAGLTGVVAAIAMQYWMNTIDYPYIISGKPLFSWPANIPVTFEIMVLFSAFTTVFGMLAMNGLPKLHNPLFSSVRFRRVTDDKFFIAIEATDPRFSEEKTREFLASLKPSAIEKVED